MSFFKKFSRSLFCIDGDFSIIQSRIKLLISLLTIIVFIYSSKLIYSVFVNEEKPQNLQYKQAKNLRGNIFDRNGHLLATSLPIISLAANPQKIIDPPFATSQLVKIFEDLNYEKLLKQLSSQKKFIWIKRNVTPINEKKLNKAGIPGLLFEEDYVRIYPHSNTTAFILGYLDVDQNGIAGIEKKFDNLLKATGDNKDLHLTIDLRLQNVILQSLKKNIAEVEAEGGLAILTDINNGEILAMVSLPDFDPHNPSKYDHDELFNRASLGVYEFGSVFKPITVASALDFGAIKINDIFDVVPPLKISKYSINDFTVARTPTMDIATILAKSSNIGTVRIAMKMGVVKQKEYLQRLGFFDEIAVELPEISHAIFPRGNWSEISAATISYGYGSAITPFHLVQAIAAIVNDGYKCPLTLIKNENEVVCEQVISKKVSHLMRGLLRNVVANGGGSRAEPGKAINGGLDYCVGGKTGTSNKIKNGRYYKNESIASFVGAVPMYDPKYLIFVSIDHPKGGKFQTTGGAVAAPIVRDIILNAAPILNLIPEPEKCFFE